ncbi:MAG: hypothetical protein ACJAZN_002507 [Planctomycetota bacterium]|jgi:hypothetical protein
MSPQTPVSSSPESLGRRRHLADKLGVFAASACAVHCLAAPVILAFAPLIGSAWASPGTHWAFAAVSIPAALSLLRRNLRGRSGGRGIILLALAGSALVLLGLAAPGARWSQGIGVDLPVPEAVASQLSTPRAHGCVDECCASVHAHGAGPATLFVPIASLVTMLGGVLLVTAHVLALKGQRQSREMCGHEHL